jgi:hypothetical protein
MRGRRRSIVVAVAALGAGLAVVVAAVVYLKVAAPPPSASVVPTRVDLVGDSLARQASATLRDAFSRAGYESRIEATPGEGLTGATVTANLARLSQPPGDVLVLATSANDAVRMFEGAKAGSPPLPGAIHYRDLLGGLARQVPSRCLVVVNARELINAFYFPDRARALNAELRALAPGYANLVVVDWAEISARLPSSWFVADQMHFGDDPTQVVTGAPGADAFVEAILAGVRRCPAGTARGSG